MSPAVMTISIALDVDLGSILPKIEKKQEFIGCCEKFVEQNEDIKALRFCAFLRNNGFPVVAKTICQYLMQTNPGLLSRTLAA